MIFLSASIPIKGREYYGTANVPAIREAVMAFTKVCMDLKIPFYFGGHPAISPLVYQVAKEYGAEFAANIKIYQSEWFKEVVPSEINYYQNIAWTKRMDDVPKSVFRMREEMFKNPTQCAVFIGGMDGIIDEAKLIHKIHPQAKLLPIISTGGACADLQNRTNIICDSFPANNFQYAYVHLFREYLRQFK